MLPVSQVLVMRVIEEPFAAAVGAGLPVMDQQVLWLWIWVVVQQMLLLFRWVALFRVVQFDSRR